MELWRMEIREVTAKSLHTLMLGIWNFNMFEFWSSPGDNAGDKNRKLSPQKEEKAVLWEKHCRFSGDVVNCGKIMKNFMNHVNQLEVIIQWNTDLSIKREADTSSDYIQNKHFAFCALCDSQKRKHRWKGNCVPCQSVLNNINCNQLSEMAQKVFKTECMCRWKHHFSLPLQKLPKGTEKLLHWASLFDVLNAWNFYSLFLRRFFTFLPWNWIKYFLLVGPICSFSIFFFFFFTSWMDECLFSKVTQLSMSTLEVLVIVNGKPWYDCAGVCPTEGQNLFTSTPASARHCRLVIYDQRGEGLSVGVQYINYLGLHNWPGFNVEIAEPLWNRFASSV